MELNNKKPNIHDDSHAKAILKGAFRKTNNEYIQVRDQVFDKFSKKTQNKKNHYKLLCQIESCGLGSALINSCVEKISSKREISYYFFLGWVDINDKVIKELEGERLYPVARSEVDSADPFSKKKYHDTKVLFYFTEHALIKMILRNNLHGLKSITAIVKKNIHLLLLESKLDLLPNDGFVIVNGDSYMPCTRKESGNLVIKTWISRASWTPENEAKLNNLCDFLANTGDIRIFSNDEFNSAVYLEPC